MRMDEIEKVIPWTKISLGKMVKFKRAEIKFSKVKNLHSLAWFKSRKCFWLPQLSWSTFSHRMNWSEKKVLEDRNEAQKWMYRGEMRLLGFILMSKTIFSLLAGVLERFAVGSKSILNTPVLCGVGHSHVSFTSTNSLQSFFWAHLRTRKSYSWSRIFR